MWYSAFLLLALLLAVFGLPADRRVWLIIALSTVVSQMIGAAGLDAVVESWKLVPYAFLEVITINALYGWAWCRTARLQSVALCGAWSAHALLYFDLITGSSIIYVSYEWVIMAIAGIQLLIGYDGFAYIFRRVARYLSVVDALPGTRPICGTGLVVNRPHAASEEEGSRA